MAKRNCIYIGGIFIYPTDTNVETVTPFHVLN